MLKEIVHFVRHAGDALRLQRELPRAEFSDHMMSTADTQGYAEVRRELVGDLTGKVLEIGCGTGNMFDYYGPGAQVQGIEPDQEFLALALPKAGRFSGRIQAGPGDGMNLALPDGAFDAVVLGLVLCSVPSVEKVLAEAFRVLKVGGRLRALDHVRSQAPVSGFLMDLTDPLWLRLNNQGCHWNRDPVDAMTAAGFVIDDVQAFQRFDTVLPAFPMRRVRAHKAGRSGA
jgi:ubiquinone/menaquinone biosynthesis C-methylase UbiE